MHRSVQTGQNDPAKVEVIRVPIISILMVDDAEMRAASVRKYDG
jgi:hypothetical protein